MRVNKAINEVIKVWFRKLNIFKVKNILIDNWWNMNEVEIMKG